MMSEHTDLLTRNERQIDQVDAERIRWFQNQILTWFDEYGRHDLPWQVADPYWVWVSEIMLQQTQVKTVLKFYTPFMQRFPTVDALAQAHWDEVAPYWAGLGYYARARNLHRAAQIVAQQGFPHDLTGWMALPGVGPSTAGALLSLGQGTFGVILDGNVKRVLSRFFAIAGDLNRAALLKPLWALAEQLTPRARHTAYTQAIMDMGATICTPKVPRCMHCPLQLHCEAFALGKVEFFPQKSSKKLVPIKHAHVLIIQCQGMWLWQKRPHDSLWGGLYGLPILSDDETIAGTTPLTVWRQQQGSLPEIAFTITHHFTHFTWRLNCYVITVNQHEFEYYAQYFSAQAFEPSAFLQQAVPKLALPRAMQRILDHMVTLAV